MSIHKKFLFLLMFLLGFPSGCVKLAQWGVAGWREGIYDLHGIQLGQTMPELTVYDLAGQAVALNSLWQDKPLVLITGSITCPVARKTCPLLDDVFGGYKEGVGLAIVYVYEPHPHIDPSPYTGDEWLTGQNRRGGFIHRQPRTLEQRLLLANKFNQYLDSRVKIFVDGIENKLWMTLGSGPNSSVLISSNGLILKKYGWHNNKKMLNTVQRLISSPEPAHYPDYAPLQSDLILQRSELESQSDLH